MARLKPFPILMALSTCISRIIAVLDADPQGPEPRPAHRMLGGKSFSNLTGISDPQQDIFERQGCKQGYSQCAYTGECCPLNQGANCCETFCIGLQPAGTKCCQGYMCPPNWECCGTSGHACSPNNGVCCTASGIFCPNKWSCCGDQGHCYPTDGWHCCSNNGNYCPNESDCVYCSSGSTEICCQGSDGSIIPPYNTNTLPAEGGGSTPTSIAIPNPSTPAPETTALVAPTTSIDSSLTSDLALRYYTTTFTYTVTVWTRITYIQSTADHTIRTTSSILSCLASNRADALTTFSSLASSIQASEASSAAAASPLSTESSPTATAAVTTKTKSGVGLNNVSIDWRMGIISSILIVLSFFY